MTRKKVIAMAYDTTKHDAPVIQAKGQGHVAQRILDVAAAHDIPIQEDAALVAVLSTLDLQQAIPPALYGVVAELLSTVYRAEQQLKKS